MLHLWRKLYLTRKILAFHSGRGPCHAGSLDVSNFAYLGYFMQDRQGQTVPESPRPIHGRWHGLLVSILIGLICTKPCRMWNILGIPCPDDVCVYHAKIALMPTKPWLSKWKSNQRMANGRCVTLVSVIAECWHINCGMWGVYDSAKTGRSL